MPSSSEDRSPRRRPRSPGSEDEPGRAKARRRVGSREREERRHDGHGGGDHADDHRMQQRDEAADAVARRSRSRSSGSRGSGGRRSRSRSRGSAGRRSRSRSRSRARRSRSRSRSRSPAAGARRGDRDAAPPAGEQPRGAAAGGGGWDRGPRDGGRAVPPRRRPERWGYHTYEREGGEGGGQQAGEVRKGRGFGGAARPAERRRSRSGSRERGRGGGERGRWGEEGEARRSRSRSRDGDRDRGGDRGGDRAAPPAANGAGGEDKAAEFLQKKAAAAGRAGGAYIPPFRLARLMADIDDKNSAAAQRLSWEALRKSLNGLINKVNAPNLKDILPELFAENLMRGRGLFCQAMMKAQLASPSFSALYAALLSVVNTKFPELGELLCHRLLAQFKRAYKRNDKPITIAASKFIAHLINQGVLHEVLALEMLILLLENPTDDSVEMAVEFCKEVGAHLQDVAPAGLHSVFERFRAILHEGAIDKRCQYMIEGLFAVRKAGFAASGHPAVAPALDLVEDEDQITHEMSLDDKHDPQAILNVFREDPDYAAHEAAYRAIAREILGDDDDGDDGDGGDNGDESGGGEGSEGGASDDDEPGGGGGGAGGGGQDITDATGTDVVNLRRTIYLTIMSSLDFEEAGHKLMKIALAPGQEGEIPIMIIECCSQEKTFVRYYALLGARFCMLRREFQATFEDCFAKQYCIIHRLETNKLRNVAKLFAHLLAADAISWGVLGVIRLTEEDTTSSSRIFIKYLFQELSEYLGLAKLNARLAEPSLQPYFTGIFPADTMADMRFSINFFTSIGLGGITDRQRELYKQMPKIMAERRAAEEAARAAAGAAGGGSSSGGTSSSSSSDSSSSSGSSSSDSSSSSSSDSSSGSSDSEDSADSRDRRRRRGGSRERGARGGARDAGRDRARSGERGARGGERDARRDRSRERDAGRERSRGGRSTSRERGRDRGGSRERRR
ncbi:Cwc22 [Scenedesmus sp. PABB004]|nr:Cwc22 [Scenedesmus sp. PABB004]